MVTNGYGICLLISIAATLMFALKNDSHVNIYDWSISLLLPFLIMGYWLKTQTASQEAALVLFAFINLSTTVVLAVILFSMLNHLSVSVSPGVKFLVYAASFAQLIPVWFTFRHGIPQDMIQITDTGDGYSTRIVNGSFAFSHLTFILAALIFIVGIIAILQSGKKTYSRQILTFYLVAVSLGMSTYVIENVLDLNFSMMPYLYMAADVLIAVNEDRYRTHDIATMISEHEKIETQIGYVAVGTNGQLLSANEKSFEFLPELRTQRVDAKLPEDSFAGTTLREIIRNFTDSGVKAATFQSGDMICAFTVSPILFHRGGMPRGYLIDIRDVTEQNRNMKRLAELNNNLNELVSEKTRNIEAIQEKLVLSMADMVENRDSNTGGHVKRTSDVVRILVEDMLAKQYIPISEEFARDVTRAAPMHDLGKVSIDNGILNKPGRLTPEEFGIMKTHSTISGQMVHILLDGVEEEHLVQTAYHVARYHHERWDGKGYPDGLVGEMIPLEARIMAVADVYDALVSKRVYKPPMSFEKAGQIMMEGMGTQFDPNMLLVFQSCRDKLERYYTFFGQDQPEDRTETRAS